MGSINKGHHEGTGGVLIFNGELILLFCEGVNIEVDGHGSVSGKIYLTTHRVIFTTDPGVKSPLRSLSAPFYAMFDLKLEQPVFGANYIKGKVKQENHESGNNPPYAYKIRFNKGGAIEFGQAMSMAAKQANDIAMQSAFQPPPAYTPSPAEQYYQAPGNVYQPMYPVGFALPTQVFNQAPPAGFIYAMDAPPPYPGITTVASQQQHFGQQQFGLPQQSFGQQQGGFGGLMAGAPVPGFQPGFQTQPPQQAPGFYPATQQPVYPQQPMGQPPTNPFYSGQANGASAPSFEQPPSYSDATKKTQ